MLDVFGTGFMMRALVAAVITSAVCSFLGVFVVLRGLAFLGSGIAHAAFGGAALGLLIGVNPLITALLFALIMSLTVGAISRRGELRMDVSIGILFSLMMALGVLFIGMMESYTSEVFNILFGYVLGVSTGDIKLILLMSAMTVLTTVLLYKEFKAIIFDEESAEAMGIRVGIVSDIMLLLISVTIVSSLRTVGAILVFALLTGPAAAAHQITHKMSSMIGLSITLGVVSSIAGLILSYWYNLPSGATIVLVISAIFFISLVISPKRMHMKKLVPWHLHRGEHFEI